MNAAFTELRAAGVPVTTACALLGRARATHYRHAAPPVIGPRPPRAPPDTGQALTDGEKAAVIALLGRDEYAGLSIGQIYHRELDAGNYLYSLSSMRIARAEGQTGERRRQATHPPKVKPELAADGPSQVWSWNF